MTKCPGTPADEWLEQYIQGTLPEMQQQEFEEHYFDCPVCLARVQALQAMTVQLGRQPVKTLKAPLRWPVQLTFLAAVAAMLVIGFLSYRRFVHSPTQPETTIGLVATKGQLVPPVAGPAVPQSKAFSALADLNLPAFQAPNLRGQSDDSVFTKGMKGYASNDCQLAVKTLSQVSAQDKNALTAQFYIGGCQMHQGDLAAASSTLRRVANAGDSPQQEAAFYYLAQIALSRNDESTARHYLGRTISLHGDFQRRAQTELSSMPVTDGNK